MSKQMDGEIQEALEAATHAANWLCEQFENNEALTLGANLAAKLARIGNAEDE